MRTFAPASMRMEVTSGLPPKTEQCRAELPFLFRTQTFAPAASAISTPATHPVLASHRSMPVGLNTAKPEKGGGIAD